MKIVQQSGEHATTVEVLPDKPTLGNYIAGGILVLFGAAGDTVDLIIAYNAKQMPHTSHLIEWGIFIFLGVVVMFTKQVLPTTTKVVVVVSNGVMSVFRGRRKDD